MTKTYKHILLTAGILALLTVFSVGFIASQKKAKVSKEQSYLKWLNAPENGLVKDKQVNNLILKATYMPQEYLVFRELGAGSDKVQREKLLEKYRGSYNFLLSIKPAQEGGVANNLIWYGVKSYQEYKQQVNELNFRLKEYLTLKTGEGEYKPVLTHLQNYHGLRQGIDFMVAFAPTKEKPGALDKASTYDLVFDDRFFETGLSHFVFHKKDMDEVPPVNFWNK